MKKISMLIALCALTLAANAADGKTYSYKCAITEITVDTLKNNTKNQYTVNIKQYAKNTAEYNKDTVYYNTVKLVLNSNDRTLEGVYTTQGADPDDASANTNDQTIGLVTSEMYSGKTRRLLRSDSISKFVIEKVDETHYQITECTLYFTAAALQDRGKNTYAYKYSYAYSEIGVQGIGQTPFVFGYDGIFHEKYSHYDMTVSAVDVIRDDTDYSQYRYFLTLLCTGKDRETEAVGNYEVQLAIYPDEASIVGTYATQGSGVNLLYASNCYVKEIVGSKSTTRYLANDSLSTIQIKDKGGNNYSFHGGTLIVAIQDFDYHASTGKKRIAETKYYHFADNGGAGIEFGYDESNTTINLTPSKVDVEQTMNGFDFTVTATNDNGIKHTVYITVENESFEGTHSYGGTLSAWTKVSRGVNDDYAASGSKAYIVKKSGNTYTLSANILSEGGKTYVLKTIDFNYGTTTGLEEATGTQVSSPAIKVCHDGIMYIEKNGTIYTLQGTVVK